MGIGRSTWTDDDGSGTVGSPIGNAELQKIYDNIDAYIPAPTVTLSKLTTEQSVVSSAALTSVFTTSVPGGSLSTAGVLKFTMTGECNNTTGAGSTFAVNVTFGGVNVTTTASLFTIQAGATHEGMMLEVWLNANGATNAQRSLARLSELQAGVLSDTFWSVGAVVHLSVHSSLAIDSTIAQTFQVNVQHASASASISFKRWTAMLELVRP
jgi:hypothetical protein